MTSSMCKHAEHEVCGKVLQLPSGKTFRCDCDCHKPHFGELTEEDLAVEREILNGTILQRNP